jgi:choline dehydrogenase-like flavoprotein
MRDIIVVGAGGGGAVIAKELGGRGLDVLLLEAGPRFADPEHEWSHFESDCNNPSSGYFRFGPADRSQPPWVREIAQRARCLFSFPAWAGRPITIRATRRAPLPALSSTIPAPTETATTPRICFRSAIAN